MRTVTIVLQGCDDQTAFTAWADYAGMNVLRELQRTSNRLGDTCKPTLSVYEGDITDSDGGIESTATQVLMWPEDLEPTP